MLLAHEDGPRLKIAVVGCGNHAYRSLFPCFEYLPVDLVAVCDVDMARAKKYAAHYGAKHACGSLREVIAAGEVQAVVISVGPKQHPDIACEALAGGLHVWMEKPPAMRVSEVDTMIATRDKAKKNVAVGFKKMFMPAARRMKAFLDSGKFGALRTIHARFPMDVPLNGRELLASRTTSNWINNGVHPLSLMVYFGGRPHAFSTFRAGSSGVAGTGNGGGYCVLQYPNGVVGGFHMTQGQTYAGPLERYELICDKGHLVLDNNVRLTVYRPGFPFDYRSGMDFTAAPEDSTAIVYEPQNTLSTLENKAIVLQGFMQELDHFVTVCLKNQPVTDGTLEMARTVMECYEAGLISHGEAVQLDELPCNKERK
ncbi:MAG TPA: Gfo/Idh/MocA family oxidoreductase [Planctomycetota bacterium]|nr:Gfo/Idh/MocA family oxidoreductase [Planctomycetota bacterium]